MPIYLNREEEIKGKAPLEFYGDGQNLKDWEIQGRTSENLFDTSVYNNTVGSIRCTVTSTLNSITIEATGRDPYVGAYLPEGTSISVNFRSLYIPVKPNTTYTINMSSAPKCYWLKVDENDISRGGGEIGTLPFSFTTDEFTKYVTIRFGNGNLQEGDSFTIENIQLIEGTYTTSTIPPYEPYGGVGVRTENLFDGTLKNGYYTNADFDLDRTEDVYKSLKVYLTTGTYTINWSVPVKAVREVCDGVLKINSFENKDTWTLQVNTDGYYGVSFRNLSNTQWDNSVKIMLTLGSTAPDHYIPYGYKIPVKIEGENLYTIELGDDRWGTLGNSQIISRTDGVLQIEMTSETNSGVYALSASAIRQLSGIRSTVSYSFDIRADTDISVLVGYEVQGARAILRVSDEWVTVKFENILFTQLYSFTIANRSSGGTVYVRNFMFNEGTTAFPYEGTTTNLYTDHQLLDGDSISLSSTQINIPTLNTHNILTVPTQVQPSNITIILPQTETEITKILGPLINPRYDITDAYFGNLQVFTVWDTYTGPLPTTLYTTDWGLVDYKIYGTADGAGIKTKNLYNYNASGAVSLNLYPSEENGKLLSGQNNVSIIFAVKPDTVYSIYKLSTTRFRWACYAAAPQEGDEATSFSSSVSNTNTMITFVTDSNAAYAVVFIKASSDSIDRDVLLRSVVVVEGPYAAQDVPYGYKIPMRSQNSVVDIYIGDTPLGENEYVSYSEQKIYRYINGVLTPTDPPKELPTITTINGNTTIDTTLEEKQYITSDNKVYCVKNGGRYLLKGSGLRPDNFYSKYRKGGT